MSESNNIKFQTELLNFLGLCKTITKTRFQGDKTSNTLPEIISLDNYEREVRKLIEKNEVSKLYNSFFASASDNKITNADFTNDKWINNVIIYFVPLSIIERKKTHPQYQKIVEQNKKVRIDFSTFFKHGKFFNSEVEYSDFISRSEEAEYTDRLCHGLLKLILLCMKFSTDNNNTDIRSHILTEYKGLCNDLKIIDTQFDKKEGSINDIFMDMKDVVGAQFPAFKGYLDQVNPESLTKYATELFTSPETVKATEDIVGMMSGDGGTQLKDDLFKALSNPSEASNIFNEETIDKLKNVITPVTNKALKSLAGVMKTDQKQEDINDINNDIA